MGVIFPGKSEQCSIMSDSLHTAIALISLTYFSVSVGLISANLLIRTAIITYTAFFLSLSFQFSSSISGLQKIREIKKPRVSRHLEQTGDRGLGRERGASRPSLQAPRFTREYAELGSGKFSLGGLQSHGTSLQAALGVGVQLLLPAGF